MRPRGAPAPRKQSLDGYVEALLERAATLRAPEIFAPDRPETLYHLADRHGVDVVALPTTALSGEELNKLLQYRLAHYLAVGFVEPALARKQGLKQEPGSEVAARDIHVVAGSTADGDILCYMALRAVDPAIRGVHMRSRLRPLFPVEEVHGVGLYDPLPLIADLPAVGVRELGRFVRNQLRPRVDELASRAGVEVCMALVAMLAGPLRTQVKALIGDVEDAVAKRNLDFFDFPTVSIHGTIGYEDPSSYLSGRYAYRAVYPFAGLCADLLRQHERFLLIEKALELPGRRGLLALLALKRSANPPQSTLQPSSGLPALTKAEVPHAHLSPSARKRLRIGGHRLRSVSAFAGLSEAEATVLRTFMTHRKVRSGTHVVRQGERSEALYVLESGRAEARVRSRSGRAELVSQLGSGDYFGEVGLVLGIARTADVVAITELTLLELSQENYERYLSDRADVDAVLAQTAVTRLTKRQG